MFPETVRVPVVIFMTSLRPAVVAERAIDAQVIVPAFIFMVPVKPVAGLGIVNAPVIAIEFVPLIVTTLFALIAAKVSDAHWAAMSTVQFAPEAIVAATAPVGTPALQFPAVLQLPVPLNVVCAIAIVPMHTTIVSRTINACDI